MPLALVVPDLVRQRARAHGTAGTRWLHDLPEIVASLVQRWDLEVEAVMTGGTASLVVAVRDGAGRPCVLKLPMRLESDDDEVFARSAVAHRLAGGRGCAELYAADVDAPALLLERLGPNLGELGMPVPRILEVIASTLRTFWGPVPDDSGLRTGVEQAAWLTEFIETTWESLDRPCERAVIDRAVECCARRAAALEGAEMVMIHNDAHGWNTLDAGSGTYKFVDPEGMVSERAHDLAVAMREYNEPLIEGDTPRLVRERAQLLAGWCDVDPVAVEEWGYVERVSTGLANVRDFDNDDGRTFLEVARRCL